MGKKLTTGRQKAQAKYNAKPEQIKRRAQRNAARAKLMKAGKVHKGDGKDVNHLNHNTANNRMSNLQILAASANRRDGGAPRKHGKETRRGRVKGK